MMAANLNTPHAITRMPPVRGRLTADAPMSKMTWFKVGGPAEVLFRPADAEDLMDFLARRPRDLDITVIGVASNLLVRDGGIPGIVIRLGRGFAAMTVEGTCIRVGSGAMDMNVALLSRDAGLGGLEFLSGIPGSIGGALRMNAGAYGREMKDVVVAATALDLDGNLHHLSGADFDFGYRHCGVPDGWIFLEAVLQGEPADSEQIAQRIEEIRTARAESQPLNTPTGGSTFANPEGHKAWQLIDQAGCRGLTFGGAQVSPKHCNFLVNTGDATAADLERLGEEVRRRVFETSGVRLHWEIRRIGIPETTTPEEVRP